ncbi:MAG: hypothetical protein O7E55_02330 [Chloroflexi bacterium]|nr:hypothetical protein [Chloroflexota bacterium]
MTAIPGRRWVIGSLVCAALSLAVAPVVFGPHRVAAGSVAVWKGAKLWGTAGVSASFVAAVVGFYLAIWLATYGPPAVTMSRSASGSVMHW